MVSIVIAIVRIWVGSRSGQTWARERDGAKDCRYGGDGFNAHVSLP
jgi:hypothetical protein